MTFEKHVIHVYMQPATYNTYKYKEECLLQWVSINKYQVDNSSMRWRQKSINHHAPHGPEN